MTLRLLTASAVGLLLAGCGMFGGPRLEDGWSIGNEVALGDCPGGSCDALVEMAAQSEGLDPGTSGRVYREGSYAGRDGGQILSNRSGGSMYVVILDAPGGDRRAIGVFCGVGGCRVGGQPAVGP